jgi:hypothetical protein
VLKGRGLIMCLRVTICAQGTWVNNVLKSDNMCSRDVG